MKNTASLPPAGFTGGLSCDAHARMTRPLFLADWLRTAFIHYEVEPEALQRHVPFPLDLREGRAYVSLVAFTLQHFRTGIYPGLGRWLLRPISDHRFLNLRAYVRCGNETGIYFLAEWLSNALPVPLGRPFFGLPYHYGSLDYRHDHEAGEISANITAGSQHLKYRTRMTDGFNFQPSASGSLDEYLLERYTAFTHWRGRRRFFRIWHEPWPQTPIPLELIDDSLLSQTGDWHAQARLIGANYSPGVRGVWMGHPQKWKETL